jgi:hypothetical protein
VIGLVGGILAVVFALGAVVAATNGTGPSLPLLFVIGAIIGGIFGLRRATQIQRTTPRGRAYGRARSVWALSLGGTGALLTLIALVVALGPHTPAFDQAGTEKDIKKWLVSEQKLDVDKV